MTRRPVSPIAWMLVLGTGTALVVLTAATLIDHGTASFFHEGDAYLYRAMAFDPFGKGTNFAVVGRLTEAPYRFGRIGLPLTAWVLSLGRPQLVPWWLITINVASIAAVPGLAAVLLDEYGAPPLGGAVVLLAPGLLLIRGVVFAEPLLICLVLLGYILEARGRSRPAVVVFACAVLVKETALLALIPWLWRGIRRRDPRDVARYLAALLPYAAWCVWVRVRLGEFPFLAHTMQRTQALSWPGGGIRRVFIVGTPDHEVVVAFAVVTILLCCVGAFAARQYSIGLLTGVLGVFTTCFGENALRYEGEALRLLAAPQVFALLCVVLAVTGRTAPRRVMTSASATSGPQ
jgi:hypothetical protein